MTVWRTSLFLLCSIFFLIQAHPNGQRDSYKICVPKMWLEDCKQMSKIETAAKVDIECIAARDKMECLKFVQQRQADFFPVEPEEMYMGMKIPNEDFQIFQELRTIEEPEAEYRYQAIMVVKNTLKINSLEGLKGLKSCHTGVNRNVGYKIPLTMLMKRGIIGPMNDLSLSPKENELKALSQMFDKSCIVGKWSPDPKTNKRLKEKYSNLCGMCEHPEICDYPDNFSGYDGSLRCLAHNNGDVAFTKMIYVRMHFGMQVGNIPARETTEDPDQYSYLCADGSKVSVREKPCAWAARPWPGYMSHKDLISNVAPLQEKLIQLKDIGLKSNETWFSRVLGLSEYVHYLQNIKPITPDDFLTKTNYTIVIERGHGEPEQLVRLCVTSDVAFTKCEALSLMAYSIDIRPRIVCIQGKDEQNCLEKVKNDEADAASVIGQKVPSAMKEYGLTPLFSEAYINGKPQYAVAIVKKESSFNSWNDLRGKSSCHAPMEYVEGFTAPVYSLLKAGVMKDDQCPRVKHLSEFFSKGSCMSDSLHTIEDENVREHMVKQCSNGNDPIKCLDDNHGDVAFVANVDIASLDNSKYELLCLNEGGRKPLSEWENCNLMAMPPLTWLGVAERPKRPTDSITHTMLSISVELTKYRIDLFDMFGEFLKHNNVIFTKSSTGLIAAENKWFEDFEAVYKKVYSC